MAQKFTLDDLIQNTQDIIEELKHSVPINDFYTVCMPIKELLEKGEVENLLSFWTAINDHLVTYKSLLKDSTIN